MFMALVDPNNPNDHTYEPRIGRSVSIDHAARMLGVSRRTIYNRIRDGRLQTVRTLGGSQRVTLQSVASLGGRRLDLSAEMPSDPDKAEKSPRGILPTAIVT